MMTPEDRAVNADSIDGSDFSGALCALRQYDDLAYLTNGPGFLLGVCLAYVQHHPDNTDASNELRKVLGERNGLAHWPKKPCTRNRWNNPLDDISTPPTFA
jgi:hypothetical protein